MIISVMWQKTAWNPGCFCVQGLVPCTNVEISRLTALQITKVLTVLKTKILETVEIPRILWWMIRGSNCVYFFRRNAVSVEKKGVGIV